MKIRELLNIMEEIEKNNSITVSRINSPEKYNAVIKAFTDVFGFLDLPPKDDGTPTTIEHELRHVDWSNSYGVFESDYNLKCYAALGMRKYTLNQYLKDNPDNIISNIVNNPLIRNMSNVQGDALWVDDSLPRMYSMKMYRETFRLYQQYDYIWGLAHSDLNNMDFWRKHSIELGLHRGENAYVFVLPLNKRTSYTFEYVKERLK